MAFSAGVAVAAVLRGSIRRGATFALGAFFTLLGLDPGFLPAIESLLQVIAATEPESKRRELLAGHPELKSRDGVKLLGRGELKAKLSFEVEGASKSAIAAIEKAGGTVTIRMREAPAA